LCPSTAATHASSRPKTLDFWASTWTEYYIAEIALSKLLCELATGSSASFGTIAKVLKEWSRRNPAMAMNAGSSRPVQRKRIGAKEWNTEQRDSNHKTNEYVRHVERLSMSTLAVNLLPVFAVARDVVSWLFLTTNGLDFNNLAT
jgi:hypothetical protein